MHVCRTWCRELAEALRGKPAAHVWDKGTDAHQIKKVGRSQKSGLGAKKPPWLAGSVPSWLMNACVHKSPGFSGPPGFPTLHAYGFGLSSVTRQAALARCLA